MVFIFNATDWTKNIYKIKGIENPGIVIRRIRNFDPRIKEYLKKYLLRPID